MSFIQFAIYTALFYLEITCEYGILHERKGKIEKSISNLFTTLNDKGNTL